VATWRLALYADFICPCMQLRPVAGWASRHMPMCACLHRLSHTVSMPLHPPAPAPCHPANTPPHPTPHPTTSCRLDKQERTHIGVGQLRRFLEQLLQRRYLENVPTIVPLLEKEYRHAQARLAGTQQDLQDLHPDRLKVGLAAA
jgi:hypothetical protein